MYDDMMMYVITYTMARAMGDVGMPRQGMGKAEVSSFSPAQTIKGPSKYLILLC